MSHPRFCPSCGHDFYPPTPVWWCQPCVDEASRAHPSSNEPPSNELIAAVMQAAFKLHDEGFCGANPGTPKQKGDNAIASETDGNPCAPHEQHSVSPTAPAEP